PASGEYRLRLQNDLQAVHQIDSLGLLIVDHAQDVEVLPTVKAGLVAVKGAAPPARAVDAAGADVLPLLIAEDGRMLTGAIATGSDGDPRQAWTLEFQRPPTPRALLVLRAHGTDFAE